MAVTVTVEAILERHHLRKSHENLQLTSAPKARRMNIVKLNFTGTYATGGFAIDPNLVGLGKITDIVAICPLVYGSTSGIGRFVWTGGNVIISVGSGVNTMAQQANGFASMSDYDDSIFVVFGY